MFKHYIEYLRDNPHGYWFKRKLYGWGWTPVKWQGWLVIAIYVAIIMILVMLTNLYSPLQNNIFLFMLSWIIPTTILIAICYKK